MSDFKGRTLGQYTIESVIGKGGMADVYSAVQMPLNRIVAIKVMKSDIVDDEEFVERFEREVKLLVDLEHPHIVPIIDFGNQDGRVYIVMRMIDGGSLHHRLKGGALPLPLTSKILGHIGSALSFAHQKGIVHRDMKPSNVMLDRSDNAYLTDFGIAKLLQSTTKLTASNTVLGTPAYMAPEQWRGEDLDARTDIYSLGIMGYEMVTGRLPYEGDTSFTLMYKHFNEMPPPPTQFLADLPLSMEGVLLRAIAKDPDERFQSAEAFAEAFRAASEGKAPIMPTLQPKSVASTVVLDSVTPAALKEESRPTLSSTQNKTQPYPMAQDTRSLPVWMIATLGAMFIMAGISIGIILPMLQNNETPSPTPTALPTQVTENTSTNDPAANGPMIFKLANGVTVHVPHNWFEDIDSPYPQVISPSGLAGLSVLRGNPEQVLVATGWLPLQQIRPENLTGTLENLAREETFEAGFRIEQIENLPIQGFHLSGVLPEGIYADYYLIELKEGNPRERTFPEWLFLRSQYGEVGGYVDYSDRALEGLLFNLAVDDTLIFRLQPN